MIAVITATKFEIPSIRRKLKFHKNNSSSYWQGIYSNLEIIHFITGVGQIANKEVLDLFPIEFVILVGFSAGLTTHPAGKNVFWINSFSNGAETITFDKEPPPLPHKRYQSLTIDHVVSTASEKKLLSNRNPSSHLIDMESFHLAQLCKEKNIPMLSLRCIYDQRDEDFPSCLYKICHKSGHLDLAKLIVHLTDIIADYKNTTKFILRQKY